MNGKDPGWKPALKLWGRAILPWRLSRPRVDPPEPLTQLRIIWMALVLAYFSFFVVLSFIAPWDGDVGYYVWAVVALGVGALTAILILRDRPLGGETLERVRGAYQVRFFISFALSELPVLFGFVGVFLYGTRWIYLVGLPFGLLGMVLAGPFRATIEHYDEMQRGSGSPLRLMDALTEPIQPA